MLWTRATVALAVGLLAGPASSARAQPAAAQRADPASVERGRQIYLQNCVTCHGPTGRGGADAGSDLSGSAIAAARDNGAQLDAFLKVGRPERRMPSFALPTAQVVDLAAYLRTAGVRRTVARKGDVPAVSVTDPLQYHVDHITDENMHNLTAYLVTLKMKVLAALFASHLLLPPALLAQGPLDPALLLKPPTDAWPTYHGDYTDATSARCRR